MYTATMNYPVNNSSMQEFIDIWKKDVFELAKNQPGFAGMQLLVRDDQAMAIGSWEDKQNAEDFMATGVFKNLMEKVKPLLAGNPVPTIWNLEAAEFTKKSY